MSIINILKLSWFIGWNIAKIGYSIFKDSISDYYNNKLKPFLNLKWIQFKNTCRLVADKLKSCFKYCFSCFFKKKETPKPTNALWKEKRIQYNQHINLASAFVNNVRREQGIEIEDVPLRTRYTNHMFSYRLPIEEKPLEINLRKKPF